MSFRYPLRPLSKSSLAITRAVMIWLLLALAVGVVAYFKGLEKTQQQASARLSEMATKLEIELDKYRTLPKVLALHPDIQQSLQFPEQADLSRINHLLSRYNQAISSDVVYLIDADGLTLASSNWDSSESFIGTDYRFRPYFTQAMEGGAGSYFALGTVSGKRGYYFSYPVRKDDQILGVLVIKVALTVLEESWSAPPFEFLLTDVHGVVFYSSYPKWNYHTLARLAPDTEAQLLEQRQYGSQPIPALTEAKTVQQLSGQQQLSLEKDGQRLTYLQAHQDMSNAGWRLFVLAPVTLLYDDVVPGLLLFTLVYVLLYLIGFSWRRTVEARKQLAIINEQLEHRVEERTSELRDTNEQLRQIIEKYKQTELTLKRTQNELIQAGKLAILGEMSASINHELNQPLTAMRTYTETLCLLVDRGDTEAIKQNADEILRLNKMMAKIIGQYKLFARKSVGKVGPVSVAEVISASLGILDSRVSHYKDRLSVTRVATDIQVIADAVPLEQVVINLLNNAFQAIEDSPQQHIRVDVDYDEQQVRLIIEDSGPGFSEEELSRLFEPFYTTKRKGLGLGLTISKRIIESFGGQIEASNISPGGARFSVSLPRFTD
jgi:two-component system, NtrC family, C4-dicarboxylate transport sensor histidine kinase DctB